MNEDEIELLDYEEQDDDSVFVMLRKPKKKKLYIRNKVIQSKRFILK